MISSVILKVSFSLYFAYSFLQLSPVTRIGNPVSSRFYSFRYRHMFHSPFRLKTSDSESSNFEDIDSLSPEKLIAYDTPIKLPEIEVPEMKMTSVERLSLWEQINVLEPELKNAVESGEKDYAELLKSKISDLKASEPYFTLHEKMKMALEKSDFSGAAKYKLQMDKIGVPKEFLDGVKNKTRNVDGSETVKQAVTSALMSKEASEAANQTEVQNSGTFVSEDGEQIVYSAKSVTSTNRVDVEVVSQYFREQSNPTKHRYIFLYRVAITNNSPFTVQLVSRKWQIRTINPNTNKTEVQEVSGPGVVGQQPILEPGQIFEYNSACPITQKPKDNIRVLGRMEGCYLMVTGSNGQHYFQAKINPFYLILPPDVMP
mmetsp:Transcript_17496/g.25934  ORF Transcript_17496/g.25934 Transcript_17496/m.25934 type:complete len:373 (+) Transcript_17496:121-1239(+)